ncbi:MBL fold metallo-hydrolase [Streptomyces sp. TRM 70351]|uniref:MBL fold metallo-hydrolase n=1 Tax=Streptomyces sp. TRM 70351 TaxID=3116552 RepID=UPI002E7AB4F4|nr:MBL fold metallo-hydrolase [Streptomyces sp. TRM 70351]MEE1929379.1 MBL fold metallo-hydrolase [Streptomyces sp. TRM 70351]
MSARAAARTAPGGGPGTPHLRELADGVFAYVQPDGGWCLNNAGVLHADGRTALVDTAATEARALALRDAAARVAPAPPRYVVNTHPHGDHTFGNCVFTPEATVVAHEGTRAEMAEAGLHLTGLWPDVCWGGLSVRLPDVTFRDAATLHVGGLRAELLHLGTAHTTNDTVVWLPEQRVLFAGDVVMSGATPFCLTGSVAGSLAVVERLRELRPRTVVAGHGPVGGPELLDTTRGYLRRVQELAAQGIAAGLTPLQTAREADLGPYAELLDAERLVPNLHRAYAEARGGAPGVRLDIEELFAEMIAFHGRLPLCHA